MTNINLCTLNVNGIQNKEKGLRVIDWVKRNKCSIALLQETHLNEETRASLEKDTDFIFHCSHGTTASRGVAIGINKHADIEVINKFCDNDGRLILLNVKMDNVILSLVCLYTPNYRTG